MSKSAEMLTVRVRRGDSLWKLAHQHLGEGRRWPEIHALNPKIENPHLIYVGDVVRVPLEAIGERKRRFQVRRGDTLWRLAQVEFGSGLAWGCIARANPSLANPDLIYPGQTLDLPSSCAATL